MPFPVRETAFVELIRQAYASCDVSNRVLGVLFSLQPGELADMRRRYRWPRRVNVLLEMTAAEKFVARQAADEARAIALYGCADAVADVLVLRRCGFVVYRWGTKVMVGGVLVSLKRMREMAARERRLAAAAARPRGNGSIEPITQERAARSQAVQAPLHARPRRPAASAEVVTAPVA